MKSPLVCALLSALALLPAQAQAARKPVTLDDVTRAAAPDTETAPVWSPDGSRFVSRVGSKVLLYDVAARRSSDLIALDRLAPVRPAEAEPQPFGWENRRVRPQPLQWLPDGQRLLLSHQGDLFLASVANGKTEPLTQTAEDEADPKLSPDGRLVSFRRGNDLYSMDLGTRTVRRLTRDSSATLWNARLDWVYPEELGLGTAHWWSPDSQRIAYLQFDVSRELLYPHADLSGTVPLAEPERYPRPGTPNADVRVGILAVNTGHTRWVDLGDPRDSLIARVDWSPDGQLFVQRLNRVQNRLDLLAVDATTGAVRTVLRETDRAWVNIADDLRFLPAGEFLWSSERDGYRHLYVYGPDGQERRRLTQGEWEVSGVVAVRTDDNEVLYLSTEASPLERQLYRVGLDGTGKRRLTTQRGTHAITASPAGAYLLDTFSSLTEPSRKTLMRPDGREWAVLRAADRKPLEEFDLLPAELLQFRDKDGRTFHARLIRPAGFQVDRRYPAIVMVYGGPHSQTVRHTWSGVSWEQALAHRGFVVWQMDNRGSAGRGHAWESALYRRFGATELEDQQAGVRHLLSLGFVDPERVGIYGWSYGGFMTLYALTHAPTLFRAGVAGAPVTNWELYDTIYTERYLGLPQENADGYRLSSPVHAAGQLQARLMLVHNYEDDNVHFQNTFQMMGALQKEGKPFETQLYPQKAHGVTGPLRRHMLEAITGFFERNLGEGEKKAAPAGRPSTAVPTGAR